MSQAAGLHLTEIGDGPPVAFLHGLFGQGKNWTSIAKALAHPAANPAGPHRSLLLDMPNHGRSPWSEAITYPAMADQVAETLRPYGRVQLVGHSMGGKIAMKLALRHPDLVERLCVVDISPVAYDQLSSFSTYVKGLSTLDLSALGSRAQADEHMREFAADPVVRSFLLQNLRRNTGSAGGWHWQPNLELIAQNLSTLGDWPAADEEPTTNGQTEQDDYNGPVLWVAGADSDYITAAYEPAMREQFPRVSRVSVKGSGHWVHSEQPEVFIAILRRFLNHDFAGDDHAR